MANTRAKRADRPNPRENRKSRNSSSNVIQFDQFIKSTKKKVILIPRNLKQEDLLANLSNQDVSIVFAVGPAGSGKSYISTLWAIQEFKSGKIDKIVITRPNVAVDDRDIGFLPGDIFKKLAPWCMPILDIFAEYFSQKEIQSLLENGQLELCPVAFIRGRTFKNSIVIVDEAQGTTANSMLSILTRIGENSKMIVTGDIRQSDRGDTNGLSDFLNRFKSSNRIAVVQFTHREIVRHEVVEEVLKIYGQDD